MARPHRLYVDTNIFIRLFEGNDDLAAALTRLFLSEPKGDRTFLATSELTLAEVLVVPVRAGDDQMIDRYANWTTSNAYLEVGPVDRSVLWSAAVLRARYPTLKLPDAIHLATAFRFGCSQFLTGDQRLSGTYELFHSHWGMVIAPGAVDIVRPERDYILTLVEPEVR